MRRFKMFFILCLMITVCFLTAFLHDLLTFQDAYTTNYTKTSTNTMEVVPTFAQEDAITIILDAGHGGYDSGSIANDGTQEKDITLAITMKIGAYLEDAGCHVVYTREQDDVAWENDNLTDLQTRVAIAKEADADYYISIHTNSSAYNDGAAGYETYVDGQNKEMINIAEHIHEKLASLPYSSDRGIKTTEENPLYVVDHNVVPALLLELGFISDDNDKAYMINQQDALAEAIAQGILQAL